MRLIGSAFTVVFVQLFFSAVLFLFIIFTGCNLSKDNPIEKINKADSLRSATQIKNDFPSDSVIENILCEKNNQFSYAVFLPKNYQGNKGWPVILFFDPHAAGDLPLKKYRSIANEFGFILAGSNSSKNNLNTPGIYPEIYKALRADIQQKFNVENNRIYLAGFSGGARVALSFGLADTSIAGVIANSAGFDPASSPMREGFAFCGIAGDEDFNLLEQRRTEKNLLPYQGIFHQLMEFNGKHEWAPEEQMRDAFVFLGCVALTKKFPTPEKEIIINRCQTLENELKNTTDKKLRLKILQRTACFKQAGVCSVGIQKEIEGLNNSVFNKKIVEEEEKADAEETTLQNNLTQKIFSENVTWWQKTVTKWQSADKNKPEHKLNCRLQSYMSMVVYLILQSPEGKKEVLLREKLLAIYELVDPENPEWAYQKAVLRAQQNNRAEALQLLNECARLNFNDKMRVANQAEFSLLFNDSSFPSSLK